MENENDTQNLIKEELLDIIHQMLGDENDVRLGEYLHNNYVVYNIVSKNHSSLLIGQNGGNIISLELVLNHIIKNKTGEWRNIRIDVDYYRQKKIKNLTKLARDVISKVRVLQKPIRLDPMPSFDRRVIHEIISEYDDLETYSEGPQRDRRLIVTTR